MPGMGELIVILLIVLVVFGANKLPGIGDALGRSIKNFKKASNVDGDDDDDAKGKKNLKDKADKKELAAAKQSKQGGASQHCQVKGAEHEQNNRALHDCGVNRYSLARPAMKHASRTSSAATR